MLGKTFVLDAFNVKAHDIAEADVNSLLALSVSVGWSHRAEDWEFVRGIGRGQVAMDETGRVHGAAMWFPFGEQCATIGMVMTTPRLQTYGGGQWLMHHILEQAQGRALGLHSTRQSHRLFLSLGFGDEGTVYQHEGYIGTPPERAPATDAEIREFHPSDLTAIRELDRTATGWDRQALIDAVVARSRGTVLLRMGRVEACALTRPFGRGTVVGPIIARTGEDALNVLHPVVVEHMGKYLRIDIWDESSRLADFTRQCGLKVTGKVTRMSRGKSWPFATDGEHSMFALASQATG